MMSRTAIVACTLAVLLCPSICHAQFVAFVDGVRELAAATVQAEPGRADAIARAAHRMEAALLAWDRDMAGLESRARREFERAADQRAFQLRVELGVAYRTRGRFNDALREFDTAVTLRPSSSDLQLVRALTLEVA